MPVPVVDVVYTPVLVVSLPDVVLLPDPVPPLPVVPPVPLTITHPCVASIPTAANPAAHVNVLVMTKLS
jgi:hypothetical protein